jgi:hypothetical protein
MAALILAMDPIDTRSFSSGGQPAMLKAAEGSLLKANLPHAQCNFSCPKFKVRLAHARGDRCANTNFKRIRPANWLEEVKLRMTKKLKFWVDVACEQRKAQATPKERHALIAEVLHEFEQAGDAMRYLRADGKIGWKPTQWMLDRLADGERDARDDVEGD